MSIFRVHSNFLENIRSLNALVLMLWQQCDGKNFMEEIFEKAQKIVFVKLHLKEYIYNKVYMIKKLGKVIKFNNWYQLLLIV